MPEIKIVTEVAGRVCALPVEAGASVGDGDDIAFVEAMKMEIPVAAPAAGKLKSLLVNSTMSLPKARSSPSSRPERLFPGICNSYAAAIQVSCAQSCRCDVTSARAQSRVQDSHEYRALGPLQNAGTGPTAKPPLLRFLDRCHQ